MPTADVDDLLGNLAKAKRDEEVAKKFRLKCEDDLLALVADKPDKGRVKLGDQIKATIEFKLGYKADVDGIRSLSGPIPVKLVPQSWEFDAKAYEALRESDPKLFEAVSKFVETKPAKPSFELKL